MGVELGELNLGIKNRQAQVLPFGFAGKARLLP